jgi:hypothetical protein
MNPLGALPGSNAPQFSLNKLDWQKILRFLLVQLAGLVLTFVPILAGYKYVIGGTDYTVIVVTVVNTGAEALRRWLTGQKTDAPTQ